MFKDTENGHTNFCLNCELLQRKFDDYKDAKEIEIARYEQCLCEIEEKVKDLKNECFYEDFECADCDMTFACNYLKKYEILQKIKETRGE